MEQFLNKKKHAHEGACTCAQQTDLNTVHQAQNLQNPKNMNTPYPHSFQPMLCYRSTLPTITLTGTNRIHHMGTPTP